MAKREAVVVESQYNMEELISAAKVLNATPDLVHAALKLSGKELYTLNEAKEIVAKFGGRKIQ